MNCPRCQSAVLDERDRSGLTVDVCPSCRGVWLDRGELEKLLALAKRELEEERAYYGGAGAAAPSAGYQDRGYQDREPPSSSRRHGYQQGGYRHDERRPHYKKRGWLDNLGDIFD
jgi:Zn-finger nucleic acid-binding protein